MIHLMKEKGPLSRKQRHHIEIATMSFGFSNIYECIHLVCVAQIAIVCKVATPHDKQ